MNIKTIPKKLIPVSPTSALTPNQALIKDEEESKSNTSGFDISNMSISISLPSDRNPPPPKKELV